MSKKIASICMNSTSEKEKNIKKAISLVQEAAQKGAEWVLLPEMFTYIGPYENSLKTAEDENGPLNASLSALAKELGIFLVAGSTGERPEQTTKGKIISDQGISKVYNTLYAFSPEGHIIAKYRKTHMFELKNIAGETLYSENSGFLPGNEIVSINYQDWNIGFAICYDLRFPGFFEKLTKNKALDIIFVPAAFTKATGEAHWSLLLQSRAVENQCFVVAANQRGLHGKSKESFGHSMIIDPWGSILSNTYDQEGIAFASLDLADIKSVRQKLPCRENRRDDLY